MGTLEQTTQNHQTFDWKEWLPCGIGVLFFRDNRVNYRNKGLYTQGINSSLDLAHTVYQIGTAVSLIEYFR